MESELKKESSPCAICLKCDFKYTCPRCNVRYCTLVCYRDAKHQQCSEAFYRDCFLGGLKDFKSSEEGKAKLFDILKRVQSQDEEAADAEDLHERLSNLNLETASSDEIWDNLSSKEKDEFDAMLQDGRLGKLIDVYEPWWSTDIPLVQVEAEAHSQFHPEVVDNSAPISSLLRGAVSECLPYNVCSVLYAFAYAARLYNGDFSATSLECADCVAVISGSLQQQKTFHNVNEAIHDCINNAQDRKHPYLVSTRYSVAIIQDVIKLVESRDQIYIQAALSELWRLFRNAKRECGLPTKRTADQQPLGVINQQKTVMFSLQKKIEFYLSWCKESKALLVNGIPSLEMEFCQLSSDLAKHEKLKTKIEQHLGEIRPQSDKPKLIQEL